MFYWFKSDPKSLIKKEIQKKLKQAMAYQRIGKIREYADTLAEVENLEEQLKYT